MRRSDRGHGSPYDRGAADAYYHRPCRPHYFTGATYQSREVTEADMTTDELNEYHMGYNQQTSFKDWD